MINVVTALLAILILFGSTTTFLSIGYAQDDMTDEDGTDEDGTDEDGTDEDGTDEDGTDEDGTDEDGTGLDSQGIIASIADDDNDNDGVPNEEDNCPDKSNGDQKDSDKDGVGDACDDDLPIDALNQTKTISSDNCPNPEYLDLYNGEDSTIHIKRGQTVCIVPKVLQTGTTYLCDDPIGGDARKDYGTKHWIYTPKDDNRLGDSFSICVD